MSGLRVLQANELESRRMRLCWHALGHTYGAKLKRVIFMAHPTQFGTTILHWDLCELEHNAG